MIDQELDKKIADFKKLMLLEGKVIRDNENGDLIEVKIKLSECEYKWQLGTIVDYQKARSGETFIYVLLDGQSQAICVQEKETRPPESIYGHLYGQINHLGWGGLVVEVTYYKTKESFDKDIYNRAYIGEPFTKLVYDAPKGKPEPGKEDLVLTN